MHCLERNVASSNHIGSRQFLGMSALLSEGFSVSFFFKWTWSSSCHQRILLADSLFRTLVAPFLEG